MENNHNHTSRTVARHMRIHGRVQGVFYRDWTVETAHNLDLAGWVRNRADGSVEAHIEGPEDAVTRFVEAAHNGPPRAVVDQIESKATDPNGSTRFVRRV